MKKLSTIQVRGGGFRPLMNWIGFITFVKTNNSNNVHGYDSSVYWCFIFSTKDIVTLNFRNRDMHKLKNVPR